MIDGKIVWKRMKKIFFLIIFMINFLLFAFATETSLISTNNSLLSNDNAIVSSSNSLIMSSNNLIDETSNLLAIDNNLLQESNSLLSDKNLLIEEESGLTAYGSFVTTREYAYTESHETVDCVVALSTEQDTMISTYLGNYDKYMAISLGDDMTTFAHYFAEWERSGSSLDFYEYAEQEASISNLLNTAKIKFGVGTAVILFDVALYFIPGGVVYKAIVCLPLKYAVSQAAVGTVTGAVFGAMSSAIQGKDPREVFVSALSGAADGYMIGAITGTLTGWAKAIKTYNGAHAIAEDKIVLKNNDLVDLNGKKIGVVRDSVVYDMDGNISGLIGSDGLYEDVKRYSKTTWENTAAENMYVGIADDTVGDLDKVKKSLNYYSRDDYYSDINALMGGYMDSSYLDYISTYNNSYLSNLYDTINDIMYATSNTSMPETLSVWRGMTEVEYQALKNTGAFSKFMSTSVTGIPNDFINNSVHMEIIVQKGVKGIYIPKYSGFPGENEILLAPSDIQILSEEVRNGKIIVKAVIKALANE